jgi:hypothetical protein
MRLALPFVVTVVLVVATAAGLGACGGDDEGEEALSKAELIARSDALCKEARARTPRAPKGDDLDRLGRYTAEATRISDDIIVRFQQLEPPESERRAFDEFIAAAKRRLDDLRDARDAAREDDRRGYEAALRREATVDAPRYRRAAKRIGFKVCGSGG